MENDILMEEIERHFQAIRNLVREATSTPRLIPAQAVITDDYLFRPLSETGPEIHLPSWNLLAQDRDVSTLADVVRRKKHQWLYGRRKIGPNRLLKIESVLKSLGLHFGMTASEVKKWRPPTTPTL